MSGMGDTPRPVRIALVDDQALVLRGLSALLGDLGLEIALEAPDAERLLAALAQRSDGMRAVDVIVSDIRMPGLGGIGLIGALRERGDATPVILLTTFDDPDLMLRAVDAGAQGFLLKDAAPAALAAGNGLTGMRERIEAAGGALSLTPTPPRGLRVRATLPGGPA